MRFFQSDMQIDVALLIDVLLALSCALIMTFAATPVVKTFSTNIGALDNPLSENERRVHVKPVPSLGGLAIFLGFIVSVFLFADITKQIQGILLGSVLIVAVGAIDDIVDLSAKIKFFFQIVAALIAVGYGIRIDVLMNPNVFSETPYLELGALSIPVTVIWIAAITNSVNLIDGLDGLAAGVSAIDSVVMLVIALAVADANMAVIMASLAGACIGFMPYNINPARIFMGDTGALLLGYILATCSVIGLFKFYAVVSFAVPFLVLAVPVLDVTFSFFRRMLKHKNPMAADRGHVHHKLLDLGLSQKTAVAILYCISAILGMAAVLLTTEGEIKALFLLCAFIAGVIVGSFIMRNKLSDLRLRQARKNRRAPGDGAKGAASEKD